MDILGLGLHYVSCNFGIRVLKPITKNEIHASIKTMEVHPLVWKEYVFPARIFRMDVHPEFESISNTEKIVLCMLFLSWEWNTSAESLARLRDCLVNANTNVTSICGS